MSLIGFSRDKETLILNKLSNAFILIPGTCKVFCDSQPLLPINVFGSIRGNSASPCLMSKRSSDLHLLSTLLTAAHGLSVSFELVPLPVSRGPGWMFLTGLHAQLVFS